MFSVQPLSLAARDAIEDLPTDFMTVTGSGKTLAMIFPLLLSPNKIAITVTPLKLLQRDHVHKFGQYGIPSITINHDTPHDQAL
ncbi:hypothetical protein BDR04DRAFT_1099836 [Suillus decipiens]|nr:hypothetical protein BDR04DRAFT_1099836 [Suillus decipiens]